MGHTVARTLNLCLRLWIAMSFIYVQAAYEARSVRLNSVLAEWPEGSATGIGFTSLV